jgi:flagellar biosynthesis protein FliP
MNQYFFNTGNAGLSIGAGTYIIFNNIITPQDSPFYNINVPKHIFNIYILFEPSIVTVITNYPTIQYCLKLNNNTVGTHNLYSDVAYTNIALTNILATGSFLMAQNFTVNSESYNKNFNNLGWPVRTLSATDYISAGILIFNNHTASINMSCALTVIITWNEVY